MENSFMRKQFHAILLAAILTLAAFPALAGQTPLRLICDIWPPYQVMNGSEVSGFSTELVQAVLSRMGIASDPIMAQPWKRALYSLEKGHADALFSANYTFQRTAFALYPDEPLIQSPWVVWSRGSNAIRTLDDLKGKKIGVVQGYSYTPEFWEFIRAWCDVDPATTDETNFRKLEGGRLDALVAELGNGHYLVSTLGLSTITAQHSLEIKRDGLFIIFNKQNVSRDFVQNFSNELKRFKTTKAHTDLRRKYFGSEKW